MLLELAEPQKIFVDHLGTTDDALGFIGMGIGKTAACFWKLNELFHSAECVGALVIAPLRVANLTWPMEAKGWDQFQWMRVANLREESGQRAFLNGTAHIYVINWEAIALLVSLVKRRGGDLPYDVVIFDELTKAKNSSSKRVNMYRNKVPRANRNWGLTGTPIPNSWLDLFAQVRLVDNGERLGNHFLTFKETYFRAGREHQPWKEKGDTAKTLEGKISDITCTLKSSDWLDIPDTVYEDVEIKFTPELEKKYRRLEEELVIQLQQDKVINVANAAALVTKLLQFTSGQMYDEEKMHHAVHNLKFEALKAIAKKEKRPILIGYIFKHEETRLREQFPGIRFFKDCKRGTEEKTIAEEQRLMADWNAGKIPFLAGHPASIGHGLNLQHGCAVMAWVSLTYSRECYEQMIKRIARRGQKELTKVYRIICPGTVDDAIAEALATKADNESRLMSALQMLESYRGKNTPEIKHQSNNVDEY